MVEVILGGALSGLVAGLIAWGGLKVELRYHRRDIDRAQAAAERAHKVAERAHARIDAMR